MMRRRLGRCGQSTLEYVIMAMVIIGAVLAFATQFIRPAIQKNMEDSKGMIERSSTRLGELVP